MSTYSLGLCNMASMKEDQEALFWLLLLSVLFIRKAQQILKTMQ